MKIEDIQTIIKVIPDGIWGPKSQQALIESDTDIKLQIQSMLGVTPDGLWRPKSQQALLSLITVYPTWINAIASSFADPKDLDMFKACKSLGNSDQACFAVGDNGVGQFGQVTAQDHTPMVAIHKNDMIRRWGSVEASAHRWVAVRMEGRSIHATCEDRLGVEGRIDLNPACAKQLNINPPFTKACQWQWL